MHIAHNQQFHVILKSKDYEKNYLLNDGPADSCSSFYTM